MKKSVILLVLVIFLVISAISIKLPDTGVTGFFVKVGITGLAFAKEIMKTILTFILKLLG
jgi:uncharacterized protein YxeA